MGVLQQLFCAMTATDDQRLNPDLWDSDGNLVVPRHGIRIAMGLALAAAGAYWLFTFIAEREMRKLNPLQASGFPDSFLVTILWVALPLIPFTVSVLLLSTRSQEGSLRELVLEQHFFCPHCCFRLPPSWGLSWPSDPFPMRVRSQFPT